MRKVRPIFLGLILIACTYSGQAQKVALVLSGGGAKGLAHVGVLKALEENNIPIDYVVGTSMGGIVAGCYAAGFSASEIEAIMLSEDLQRWVSGDLEKGYNYYYSKEEANASFLSLKLSLDSTFNVSLTSSLASDLSLNFALLEKFARPAATADYDFDSLFVPVRVMAADVFTQNEIAIDSGSLASAVRSTLSVPFVYRPIKFNGKYLFDGGIYNNFPVDVAQREFDPDVIIGVNVSSKVFNDYPDKDDEALINRSLLYMLLDKSNPEIVPDSGVYIEPNLDGYTAFDFPKVSALIDSGYVSANRSLAEIKNKISRRVDTKELKQSRKRFIDKHEPWLFTDINLHGFNSKQKKFIKHIFRFKDNKPLTLDDIKKGYFRLVSEQYFHTIYPDMRYNKASGGYELEIFGRPENNLSVDIGGAIATRNISQIFLGVQHFYFNNYLLKNSLNFYTGTFYKSAQLKSKLNLPALGQFYLEADFTYNNWDYISEEDILAIKKDPTILTRTDRRYGLNIGFPVGSKFKAVANGAWINNNDQFSNFNSFNSVDTLDNLDINGFKVGVEFSRNNLNRKQYSNLGGAFHLNLQYFNVEERYEPGSTSMINQNIVNDHHWFRARATAEQYFKTGRYSTGYYFQGSFSNQPFFANYTATMLYAPGFSAVQDSESLFLQNFKAHNYLTLGIRNVFSIRKNLEFRLEGYAFKAFDAIKTSETQTPFYDETDLSNIFLAGTAGLVLHSPIGPISLSVNYYDDPETELGFLMHVGYLLFQKRSIR